MAYLEPEAYSGHCLYSKNSRHIQKISMMKRSCKISYLVHFSAQAQKKKIRLKKNSLLFLEMGLSSSNIQKIYIFSKESFSYISENKTLHFSAQAKKIKKSTFIKFLIF